VGQAELADDPRFGRICRTRPRYEEVNAVVAPDLKTVPIRGLLAAHWKTAGSRSAMVTQAPTCLPIPCSAISGYFNVCRRRVRS